MKENTFDENEEFDEDSVIVEFEDENGETTLYLQEMILEVDGESYAVLIEMPDEDDECDEDECDCEDNVYFAKIVTGSDGEDEYIEPTDEEYDAVWQAYNELWDEEEEDEN